jgi:hypothetical protein
MPVYAKRLDYALYFGSLPDFGIDDNFFRQTQEVTPFLCCLSEVVM